VETTVISAPLELSDSTDRWQQLQLLRRGRTPVQPWLLQLVDWYRKMEDERGQQQ